MPDLIKRQEGDLTYFTSPQLTAYPQVRHAFFTREGGVSQDEFATLNFRFQGDEESRVLKNFDLAANLLGYTADDVVRTRQQHTDVVEVVRSHPSGFSTARGEEPVDAVITNVHGLVLAGAYADCQLLMFYDHKTRAVGLTHAGWRGIHNQIIQKTIAKMTEVYGTRPRDVACAVGPSICRSCFETDDDVYQALNEVYGEKISDFIYRQGEKWHIDLKNITYSILISCGILPYNIDVSSACPCCGDKSLYWSHRRQGEKRGVHAGMIALV